MALGIVVDDAIVVGEHTSHLKIKEDLIVQHQQLQQLECHACNRLC